MANRPTMNTAILRDFEQSSARAFRDLDCKQRGELLVAACRDAVEFEASRLSMGLPPSQPVPWPATTWTFLAEATRRVRQA